MKPMKAYTGTKTINAKPMSRSNYNIFRGWVLPADENGNDEGYLVEYTDGGKSNTLAYKGYVSWSPKDIFERTYREVVTPTLLAYQQRVVDEQDALARKLLDLRKFLTTPFCATLGALEIQRLRWQYEAMERYSYVLGLRIDAFVKENEA